MTIYIPSTLQDCTIPEVLVLFSICYYRSSTTATLFKINNANRFMPSTDDCELVEINSISSVEQLNNLYIKKHKNQLKVLCRQR